MAAVVPTAATRLKSLGIGMGPPTDLRRWLEFRLHWLNLIYGPSLNSVIFWAFQCSLRGLVQLRLCAPASTVAATDDIVDDQPVLPMYRAIVHRPYNIAHWHGSGVPGRFVEIIIMKKMKTKTLRKREFFIFNCPAEIHKKIMNNRMPIIEIFLVLYLNTSGTHRLSDRRIIDHLRFKIRQLWLTSIWGLIKRNSFGISFVLHSHHLQENSHHSVLMPIVPGNSSLAAAASPPSAKLQ
jgi:hypothetical protein